MCTIDTVGVASSVPLAQLLQRAVDGDEVAWRDLVDSHAGLVWSIVRTYGLGAEAEADVFQTVWLRLAENLGKIREPERLAGWLARVARNESVSMYRKRSRVVPHQDLGVDIQSDEPALDHGLSQSHERQVVRSALRRISAQCQRLLTLLVANPPLSYAEISGLLEIPVGSIGPTGLVASHSSARPQRFAVSARRKAGVMTDDELLNLVGDAIGEAGPPPGLLDAAYASRAWADLDAALAELIEDSADQLAAGVRSDSPRRLVYEFGDAVVDIEVSAAGGRLTGRVAPASTVALERSEGDGHVFDDGEQVVTFTVDNVAAGPVRLLVTSDEVAWRTGWFTI